MPLQRTIMLVLIEEPDGSEVEISTEIRAADQLRAELEAKKHGVSVTDAFHLTYLWAWASLVRRGVISDRFPEFVARCVTVQEDKAAGPVTVDPTGPAAIAG